MKACPQSKQEWQNALLFAVAFPLVLLTVTEGLCAQQLSPRSEAYIITLQEHGVFFVEAALGLILLILALVFAFIRPKAAWLALLLLVISAAFFCLTPVILICY